MDMIEIFFIPISIAIIGYIAKLISDFILKSRERKFQLYERQLSEFYWPIYIRLHNNRAVWIRVLSKGKLYNKIENEIALSIEKNVILKNHIEIEEIIKSSIHIAFPDKILIDSIKLYLKHVEIYKALKESDINNVFASDLKAGFPDTFEKVIKERTMAVQNKLNKIYKNFI